MAHVDCTGAPPHGSGFGPCGRCCPPDYAACNSYGDHVQVLVARNFGLGAFYAVREYYGAPIHFYRQAQYIRTVGGNVTGEAIIDRLTYATTITGTFYPAGTPTAYAVNGMYYTQWLGPDHTQPGPYPLTNWRWGMEITEADVLSDLNTIYNLLPVFPPAIYPYEEFYADCLSGQMQVTGPHYTGALAWRSGKLGIYALNNCICYHCGSAMFWRVTKYGIAANYNGPNQKLAFSYLKQRVKLTTKSRWCLWDGTPEGSVTPCTPFGPAGTPEAEEYIIEPPATMSDVQAEPALYNMEYCAGVPGNVIDPTSMQGQLAPWYKTILPNCNCEYPLEGLVPPP